MKKLLMMVVMMLLFVVNNIKAVDLLYNENDIVKLKESLDKVDLVIEGKVLNIERYYLLRAKNGEIQQNRLISENEITFDNAGKIIVYTKIQLEVIEVFNSKRENFKKKLITLWIDGGYIFIDGEKYTQLTSGSGYPLLSINDQMILGLKKNKSKGSLSKILDNNYLNEYSIVDNLQIPSSDQMINEVEEALFQKAYYKSLNNQDDSQTISQYRLGYVDAQIEKEEKVQQQNEVIENLRQNLRSNHE